MSARDAEQRGRLFLSQIFPDGNQRADQLIPHNTDLQSYAIGLIYGDLCQRPQLTMRDREIAVLAALTALGGCPEALAQHVGLARAVGLTPDEILEIMLHCAAYVGIPRAADATTIAARILHTDSTETAP